MKRSIWNTILMVCAAVFVLNACKKNENTAPPANEIAVKNIRVGEGGLKSANFEDLLLVAFDASVTNTPFSKVVISLTSSSNEVVLKKEFDKSGSKSITFEEQLEIPATAGGKQLNDGKYTLGVQILAGNTEKLIKEEVTLMSMKITKPTVSLKLNASNCLLKFEMIKYSGTLKSFGLYLEKSDNPSENYVFDLKIPKNEIEGYHSFYIPADNLMRKNGEKVTLTAGTYKVYAVYEKEEGVSIKYPISNAVTLGPSLLEYDIRQLTVGSTAATRDMKYSIVQGKLSLHVFGLDKIKLKSSEKNTIKSIGASVFVAKDRKGFAYSNFLNLYFADNGPVPAAVYPFNSYGAMPASVLGLGLTSRIVVTLGSNGISETILLGETTML